MQSKSVLLLAQKASYSYPKYFLWYGAVKREKMLLISVFGAEILILRSSILPNKGDRVLKATILRETKVFCCLRKFHIHILNTFLDMGQSGLPTHVRTCVFVRIFGVEYASTQHASKWPKNTQSGGNTSQTQKRVIKGIYGLSKSQRILA